MPAANFFKTIAWIDSQCPMMNNATFSALEDHSLSDIIFVEDIIKGENIDGKPDKL